MTGNEILDKFTAFYSENFDIEYNLDVDGISVPVSAAMQSRQRRQIFGMPLKSLGPEARERIFFLVEQNFDLDAMSRLEKLMTSAEREYVKPSRGHAFTFLSAVVIAENIDQSAVAALKKYKLQKNYYSEGWFVGRVVVFGTNGECAYNKDGKELKIMLQKELAKS